MSALAVPEVAGATPRSGFRWIGMIFALILMNMGIVATTIYFAASDRSAGVEPDYYARALDYNREIDQRAANARLGWNANISLSTVPGGLAALRVAIIDRDGSLVSDATVRAEAFSSLRSDERRSVALSPVEGRYEATILISAIGLWRVRVNAERGAEKFTSEQDVMLDGPGAGRKAP